MNRYATLESVFQALEEISTTVIRDCRRDTKIGISAFPPQVGTHYEAFWLRDYAYMLEGNPDAFTDTECVDSCRLFIDSMRADGACVDCVAFDGTPIYMPGYGTMGVHPVADGSQFTVDIAYNTWKKTGSKNLIEEIYPKLEMAIAAMPVDENTGLVAIRPHPERERCPYGFTDTVLKEGDLLFCSLLAVQAYRHMGEISQLIGKLDTSYEHDAENTADRINGSLWDEQAGLYRAATARCREHDIWGSAFAVYTGVASDEQARRIAEYFLAHQRELTQNGQVRHLPANTAWEATGAGSATVAPGSYQNGAYWATPSGWYSYAVSRIDMAQCVSLLSQMIEDFETRGVNEWVSGEVTAVPGYVASASLPLAAVRRLIAEGR